MEKIIFDKNLNFAIKFSTYKEEESFEDSGWLNFQVVETYNDGNKVISYKGNSMHEHLIFETAFKDNPLCNGFIRWDGCMEIHSLNYHFCGYDNILQRIVKSIYLGGKEILRDKFEEDLANFKNICIDI